MDYGLAFSNALAAAIGVQAVIYCLAAIGLNVHFGYTGLLNFGQAAFLAVAAYGVAVTVATIGWSFWVGIVIGLIAAVILALLLGIPTLRLRADYLAIVTISVAEIIRLIVRSVTYREYFGGSDGITRFADSFYAINPFRASAYDLGPITFSDRQMWVITVGWILVAGSSLLVLLLMRSPWGRVIKGIREDEDAVRSLGKNVYFYKMQSLILGGVIGALGGFIFAIANQSVQADNYSTELTFFAYTILILGGAARVMGPILGAMIFWFLLAITDNLLFQAVNSDTITFITTTQVGAIRFMMVGLALIVLMVYRPQGLIGDRREVLLDAR
jgi:branched-chain amino acid transport system permease protein